MRQPPPESAPPPRNIPTIRGEFQRRPIRITPEQRLLLMALFAALPAVLVATALLFYFPLSTPLRWTLLALLYATLLGGMAALAARLSAALRTISNILMAFREGDYSLRATGAHREDALGEIFTELNLLAETYRTQRAGAVEASVLLGKIMEEIDVALFLLDEAGRVRLANPAALRLFEGAPSPIGFPASDTALAPALDVEESGAIALRFPAEEGRYTVRRGAFRQDGRPHRFLALGNISRTLRREERDAWRSLVRVLGHEINNSLTPIKSMAETLQDILNRDPIPADWREDTLEALAIIEQRADSLRRFTTSYAALARLPEPRLAPVSLLPLLRRAAGLEARVPVVVDAGDEFTVIADADQLEQALINLVRNAADACIERGGEAAVRTAIARVGAHAEVHIEDDGPGILSSDNLFVPFFSTKPGGSGIGLALVRQIAEAHGGSVSLENRSGATGCIARLRLPLAP